MVCQQIFLSQSQPEIKTFVRKSKIKQFYTQDSIFNFIKPNVIFQNNLNENESSFNNFTDNLNHLQ